jgi:uncharacterized integral membrane protein (TIGR00697 family)
MEGVARNHVRAQGETSPIRMILIDYRKIGGRGSRLKKTRSPLMSESSLRDQAYTPWPIVLIGMYLAAQMLADIASLKIGLVAGLSVDMGTFIYPITFTLRDLVHKTLGKKAARTLILTAGGVNLFMAAYLFFTALAPEDPSWGLGAEFSAILSPVWRIVIASIIAEIVSELADTEVYSWFIRRVTREKKWLRVLVSNAVSIPIDNAIFALGAFALTLSAEVVRDIFIMNLLVKFAVTLVSLPLIYIGKENETEL